jgi:hypothetical protein
MLDSHPNISNPGEFDFLVDQLGSDGRTPDMRRYRRWLSTHRGFQATGLAVDPQLDYARLMRSFIEQLRRENKVLTLTVHRHFDRLPRLFPDARYLHLIRDPRDVARSSIGMGWAGNIYRGADVWTAAERSWDRLVSSLTADRYLQVRYELLLDDLTAELTKICGFLGVSYSPRMLTYDSRSTYAAPDSRLKYQWKSKCGARELQWIDWKLGGMLVQRQYELSGLAPRKPTPAELLRIIAQDKVYRIRFRVRRYGLALYLENLLASRVPVPAWRDSCQVRMNAIDVKFLK